MFQGLTLPELRTELIRRAAVKHDVVQDTRQLSAGVQWDGSRSIPTLKVEGVEGPGAAAFASPVRMNPFTIRQVGQWAKIPAAYVDRMLQEDAPNLYAMNVNHWFQANPARRMIRTLDGDVRAFLSDRYRRIDNEDLMDAVFPVLEELAGDDQVRIESSGLTDERFFLKVVFPKVEGEVRVGDAVQSGIVVANSEIGVGALSVYPLVFRLACLNGMVRQVSGVRRQHVGRRVAGDPLEAIELYADDTMKADDDAIKLKLRDTVRAAASGEGFEKILEKMRETTEGDRIENPIHATRVLAKSFDLSEAETDKVAENLIAGQDFSRWGALNALTAAANTASDYQRATDLEAAGGRILDMSPGDWRTIAEAA